MNELRLIHVHQSRDLLWRNLETFVSRSLADALDERGRAAIALPGGTTPGPLFDRLAQRRLAWSRVRVTLTDERWVAPDDPASNEFNLRKRLLVDRAASAKFTPLYAPGGGASDAVAEVSAQLRRRGMLPLDLCLLGLGEDGHIASLIPGARGYGAAMAPDAGALGAVAAAGAAGAAERLTLTFAEILRSRAIALVLTGEAKLRVLERAQIGRHPGPLTALFAQAKCAVTAYYAM